MRHLAPLFCCLLMLAGGSPAQTTGWQKLQSSTAPSSRAGGLMCYDSTRNRLLLFGGNSYSPSKTWTDTWTLQGGAWTEVKTSQAPGARILSAVAFDSRRGKAVLFGGQPAMPYGPYVRDTWEYDGVTWKQITPQHSPPARIGHSMAYDKRRARVVLFGGAGSSAARYDDTWEWDGTDWSQVQVKNTPGYRLGASLAFDESNEEIVLFGGSGSAGWLNDTWTFDGASWTRRASTGPSARDSAGLAEDGARSRLLLFGGMDAKGKHNDLWSWSGRAWTQLPSLGGPSPRHAVAFAFDPIGHRAVLFGGHVANSTTSGETWVYQDRARPLAHDLSHVSLAGQQRQTMLLNAGNAHAQQPYLVLGSLSGTAPGIPLGPSLTLPLQPDAYLFDVTLGLPNSALLQSSLGVLDAKGQAQATWTAIPQLPSSLIGLRFHHAFLCFGATGFSFVSNAAPVTLIP